jgi:hypothetical protein
MGMDSQHATKMAAFVRQGGKNFYLLYIDILYIIPSSFKAPMISKPTTVQQDLLTTYCVHNTIVLAHT